MTALRRQNRPLVSSRILCLLSSAAADALAETPPNPRADPADFERDAVDIAIRRMSFQGSVHRHRPIVDQANVVDLSILSYVRAPRTPRVALSISSTYRRRAKDSLRKPMTLRLSSDSMTASTSASASSNIFMADLTFISGSSTTSVYLASSTTWISSAIVSKSPENNSGSSSNPQYSSAFLTTTTA